MPDQYTLTVVNDSELPQPQFAVFATLPLQPDFDSLGVAWLVQQIDEGNIHKFTWEIAWGFTWMARGAAAGASYLWSASGALPADPKSDAACAATFDYDGDFQLTPAVGNADGKHLWIADTPSVPPPSQRPSSVGVTLSGSPVSVTNAGPNLEQVFTLHPTYYIDAGRYTKGQMVDGTSVTSFKTLEYSDGVTDLTATLDKRNTWAVAPTPPGAA